MQHVLADLQGEVTLQADLEDGELDVADPDLDARPPKRSMADRPCNSSPAGATRVASG